MMPFVILKLVFPVEMFVASNDFALKDMSREVHSVYVPCEV
jgi:hypothetical protein